jgi:hypothetical protein
MKILRIVLLVALGYVLNSVVRVVLQRCRTKRIAKQ